MVATRWLHGLALLVALATAWPQRGEAQFCVGDCDGNGRVVIVDLIIGVSIALGFDRPCYGYSGDVTVAQLVQAVNNALDGCPGVLGVFDNPPHGYLVQAGTVAARLDLPPGADPDSLMVELDGVNVTDDAVHDGQVDGDLIVAPGSHQLIAFATVDGTKRTARSQFDAVALTNPDECEVLNQAECLLPYPSSRFLVKDESTATGFRLNIPASGLPDPNGPPLLLTRQQVDASIRWCRSSCTSRRASIPSAPPRRVCCQRDVAGNRTARRGSIRARTTDARSKPTVRRYSSTSTPASACCTGSSSTGMPPTTWRAKR
jgi:hypothetical protein